LLSEGVVYLGDAMAVDVAPQRGGAVDVGASDEVIQKAALGPLDDEGRLGHVGGHGGEGVPDVVAVPLFELLSRWGHGKAIVRRRRPSPSTVTVDRRRQPRADALGY